METNNYDCGLNSKSARIVPAWVGPPPCNPAGMSESIEGCWTFEGQVEVGFDVGAVEVTAGGGLSRQRCKTVTVGECTCVGTWTCEWEESKCWEYCREYDYWAEGSKVTVHYMTRAFPKASGSKAIQQNTTCTPSGSGCGGQQQ